MKKRKPICPFTEMPQETGDFLYFGIHDLSKYYRDKNQLPKIKIDEITNKIGVVNSVNKVAHTVVVETKNTPHFFGYRKLQSKINNTKKFMKKDGKILTTISSSNLVEISHLVESGQYRVWLVIDGGTNYQQNLVKAIRKKENCKLKTEELQQVPKPFLLEFQKWKIHEDKNFYPKVD